MSKALSGEKALLAERVEDPAVRLPRVAFNPWTWPIAVLIAADLAALWIWATRPWHIYSDWLGFVGSADEAPVARLLPWAHWQSGPRTLSGFLSLFEREELFTAGGLIFALVVSILMAIAPRRSDGATWRRLRSPLSVARSLRVRYRVRTALAAIAILGLYLGWEIHGWRTWRLRHVYLQLAAEAARRENQNRSRLDATRSQLASLMEVDLAQLHDLSVPAQGFYLPKAARVAGELAARDRLTRETNSLAAHAAAYAERRSKYERAAVNPWQTIEPDQPLPEPVREADYWLYLPDYERALEAYEDLTRIYPDFADPHCTLAWIRTSCPDARFRNGKLAVASATRACELTNWRDASALDRLAAASTEAGDVPAASKWRQKAAQLIVPSLSPAP